MMRAARSRRQIIQRVVTSSLSLLLFFALFSTPASAQTRRAVLAGINTYLPAGVEVKKIVVSEGSGSGGGPSTSGRGSWTNLEGSLNDVESIHQLLVTRYGFEEKNIHILTQAEATHDNILHAIQTYLADPASPGDISFFYYAGHGSQMKNSKSWKDPKVDETTVPADSYKGTWDIRDKEYSRAFMKVINKGATLTAIYDSCHSGSVTRGLSRFNRIRAVEEDKRDAADDYRGPFPENSGALVFAAAQDIESAAEGRDENGVDHGAFTAALIKVLSAAPLNESSNEIFQQTFAIMRSTGASQVPVISGSEERLAGPIFGTSAGNLTGKFTLPVVSVDSPDAIQLFGGLTLGFGPGTELVAADKKGPAGDVRLKVTDETAANSTAKVIAGSADKVKPATLFVVDRWVPSGNGLLALWVPPATLSLTDLQSAAASAEKISAISGVTLVTDPYETTPTHVIEWSGASWTMTDQATRVSKDLGRAPDFAAAAKGLSAISAKIFVNLPLPQEASEAAKNFGGQESPTRLAKSTGDANYMLIGRPSATGVEYAWLLPGSSKDASTALQETPGKNGNSDEKTIRAASSLPPETRWVAAQFSADGFTNAADTLTRLAGSLARIHGWLELPTPPDSGSFPYHLAVVDAEHIQDGPAVTTGYGGHQYALVLRADKKTLGTYSEQRRVYVFVIDSDGNGVPLFPSVAHGDVQNIFPRPDQTANGLPEQIVLGKPDLFKVTPPYGTDTYFLLTTQPQDSINLMSLRWSGVRGATRGAGSPLDRLLSSVGTRGASSEVPTDWSLERIAIQSMEKP
jgi:hypothetical protein